MMRQYRAQRCRGGGYNPLGVGVIAVGSIFYLQDREFFDSRYGAPATCRTPWQVEAFLNGTCGAARRNRETGLWEDAYRSGRSDTALVRSLRDRRQVRQVSVRLLIVHDDLGLCKQPTRYPTLPDVERFLPRRFARARPQAPLPAAAQARREPPCRSTSSHA